VPTTPTGTAAIGDVAFLRFAGLFLLDFLLLGVLGAVEVAGVSSFRLLGVQLLLLSFLFGLLRGGLIGNRYIGVVAARIATAESCGAALKKQCAESAIALTVFPPDSVNSLRRSGMGHDRVPR
jgi:hypothetical protein